MRRWWDQLWCGSEKCIVLYDCSLCILCIFLESSRGPYCTVWWVRCGLRAPSWLTDHSVSTASRQNGFSHSCESIVFSMRCNSLSTFHEFKIFFFLTTPFKKSIAPTKNGGFRLGQGYYESQVENIIVMVTIVMVLVMLVYFGWKFRDKSNRG